VPPRLDIVEPLISPDHLRQDDIIPPPIELREHDQDALPQRPHDERDEHHTKAPQREGEEPRIGAHSKPGHGEEPRRPHRENTLPDAAMDGRLVAGDHGAGLTHSVAPPTRPISPNSTVPPPSSPARVKKPMLPARI